MAASESDKPVIGIVGGIGAGKSTVAAELARLGCAVVDADAVGHELLAEDEVKADLRGRWGEEIFSPTGEVDRAALAERAFATASELEALNFIMHPRMRRRLAGRIERLSADAAVKAIVLDAAVLLEAGWDEFCTHIIYVSAPAEARRIRAAAGRGWDGPTWQQRENLQKSLDKKRSRAEYVLENSSSLTHLRRLVRQLFHRIVQLTDRPENRL